MAMFKEEELVDMCIVASGQRLKAHSLVLCAASELFRELLRDVELGYWPVVTMEDVGHADLQRVLDFIYSGEAVVDEDALKPFMELARTLKLSGLEEAWESQHMWLPAKQPPAMAVGEVNKNESTDREEIVQDKGKIRVRGDLMTTGLKAVQTGDLHIMNATSSGMPHGSVRIGPSAENPERGEGKRVHATTGSPNEYENGPPITGSGHVQNCPIPVLRMSGATYELCERCGAAVVQGHMQSHNWQWHGQEILSELVRCPLCHAGQESAYGLEHHLQEAHMYSPRYAAKLTRETIM